VLGTSGVGKTHIALILGLTACHKGHSGLLKHYQTKKEGTDRIGNLEQLVNTATLFVSEEGFGIYEPLSAFFSLESLEVVNN